MKLSWNCRTMASPVMRFSVLLRVVAILPLSSQRIFSTRQIGEEKWRKKIKSLHTFLRLKDKSVVQQRPTDKVDTRRVANKQTQTRDTARTSPAQSTGASLYFQDKMLEVISAGSPSSAAFMGCRNSHLLMCDFNNNTTTTTTSRNTSFFRDAVNIFWYQVIVLRISLLSNSGGNGFQ